MASWGEVTVAAPELAKVARELFDSGRHKILATLRRDGSPRVSGIEAWFWGDELWFGSMWQAVKALDLKRDPRFALHSPSGDPEGDWPGEAKVAGTVSLTEDRDEIARVVTGSGSPAPAGPMHLFRADVTELVHTHISDDRKKLVIDSWTPERGVRTHMR